MHIHFCNTVLESCAALPSCVQLRNGGTSVYHYYLRDHLGKCVILTVVLIMFFMKMV